MVLLHLTFSFHLFSIGAGGRFTFYVINNRLPSCVTEKHEFNVKLETSNTIFRRFWKTLDNALLVGLLINEYTQLNANCFRGTMDTQLICVFLVPTGLLCLELFFH